MALHTIFILKASTCSLGVRFVNLLEKARAEFGIKCVSGGADDFFLIRATKELFGQGLLAPNNISLTFHIKNYIYFCCHYIFLIYILNYSVIKIAKVVYISSFIQIQLYNGLPVVCVKIDILCCRYQTRASQLLLKNAAES